MTLKSVGKVTINWATADKPRSSSRSTISDDASNIARVETLVLSDKCITMEEMVAELGVCQGTTLKILHEQLHILNVLSSLNPYLLTLLQKEYRTEASALMLDICSDVEMIIFS